MRSFNKQQDEGAMTITIGQSMKFWFMKLVP